MGEEIFANCRDLEVFVFPMSIHQTPITVFYKCPNLKAIFIHQSVRNMLDRTNIQNKKVAIIRNIGEYSDVKDDMPFETKECSISYDPFEEFTQVIILRCGHTFTKDMLIEWMQMSIICPNCRKRIF